MAVRALLAVVAAVVLVGAAVATNPHCDQSYHCQYRYVPPDRSTEYNFDFSSLCSGTDYTLKDQAEHTYKANICGYAKAPCLPATWDNTYEFGVAVQFWGATPSCQTKDCTSNGAAACCTQDCQVLGVGNPTWSLLDPTNPKTGGVKAMYTGAAATDSDPFWCTFDPATGAQYPREAHFNFHCDWSVSGVVPVTAVQNSTNDCRYMLEFNTAHACANDTGSSGGISGGWIFIIILVCGAFLYVVGGMGYGYFTTRRLEFPNMPFWTTFADLVRDGFLFVGHGFKKQGGSMAGAGAYDDIGAAAPASGGASASYTAAPAAAKNDEPYTDL